MFECAVCGCKQGRVEVVDEVFKVYGEYVLVERIPANICVRCGEQSFSRQTAETVRQTVNGRNTPARLIEMRVYEFPGTELPDVATLPFRHTGNG